MKKLFFFIIIFCTAVINVFANDTYFFMSGGNLIPTTEKDTSVQMKSEVISISLEEKYYQVTVDFNFINHGEQAELLVGFPFFEAGIGGHGNIYDFKCWTNDELTDYSDFPLEHNFSNLDYTGENLQNAYVRKITFPPKSTTKTRVSYKSEYGYDTEGVIVKYLYGTGITWKNKIEDIELILNNNMKYSCPRTIQMGDITNIENSFSRLADNKWHAHFKNVEPEYTDCFSIYCSDILYDVGPKAFHKENFMCYYTKVSEKTLYWYTKPQLRILRNTIYALHGYAFKSQDLKELFETWGKYWYPNYEINPSFSESEFTENEKYNIEFILKEEKKRN